MNAKEQNNMEKDLEKILEETPVTGDAPIKEEIVTTIEDEATENVVDDTNVKESSEDLIDEKTEQIPDKSISNPIEKEVIKKTSNKRILQGVVVSNKLDKTIVIKVVRQVAHPLYKKYYKKTNKFMAHDPNNDCNIGDTVRVREARPLSKRKRWELIDIVDRAK